jgi:stalled ribosome rescue protein Dom34
MNTRQAIVWVDRREATIYHLQSQGFETTRVEAPEPAPAGNARGLTFFQRVARVLADATAILVTGPSGAKLDFVKYVYRTDHALTLKIVGVETLEKPTDRRLVGYVLDYFDTGTQPLKSLGNGAAV